METPKLDVSPAAWSVVSTLLDEALGLEPGARPAWLAGLDDTHPQLAPIMRRLLAAHAASETNDLLRWPQIDAGAPGPIETDHVAGASIGPYRLIRELGRGGMADVWLAQRADGAFERDVALKLPRVSLLRRDLALRFAHERDILARLEHPNIARFYDAGITREGLPYLAMEYVDGQPIMRWCDERCLDVAARIALFAQVLDAVQFAHASLVVHRDLKPSNILVTANGQARLLDFGIAKLVPDDRRVLETQLTRLAGRALTPDYASPEQIRGEPLTIATDVYSLGVVLYELLAGQPPYQLKLPSVAQLEQAIVAIDPARPSTVVGGETALRRGTTERRLARSLRGDLDTIVLKALAKQPPQRYATVAGLADDLRRHCNGKPVHARPASWSYRTRKFVERNRAGVGASAAIAAALVAGLLVSLWQARIAHRQAARAEAVKEFVLSFFSTANSDQGATPDTTVMQLLDQARDRLASTQMSDPAIRIELLSTVGWALQGFNEFRKAEPLLAEAAQLSSATSHDLDDTAGWALATYGLVLARKGDLKGAARQFDAAEARLRRVGNAEALTFVLRGKSELRAREGDFDAAVDLSQQAIDTAGNLTSADGREELVASYVTLADFTRQAQRSATLEPAQQALAMARALYGDRVTPLLLEARRNYALALADTGDPGHARSQLEDVRRLQAAMLGVRHTQVARTLRHIAETSLMLGDSTTAIVDIGEAVRICAEKSGGEPTPQLARAKLGAGDVFASVRRYDAALSEWRDAATLYTALYGADNQLARLARSGAAYALTMSGQLDAADAMFATMHDTHFTSGRTAIFERRLGTLRSAQGRHEEALALLREARDSAPSPWARALALADLGDALVAAGQPAEALAVLREARSALRETQRNGSPDLADISIEIARAHMALGHSTEAVAASTEAVTFWSQFESRQRAAGLALLWHGRALAEAGDGPGAALALGEAGQILAASGSAIDQALLDQARQVRR
jgi:serine/threonine-protein kinase